MDGPVSDLDFFLFSINKKKHISYNPAWTTAAVDNERVIGAVPIVMDILNLNQVRNDLMHLIK